MALKLESRDREKKTRSREEVEAASILTNLFEHDESRGAQTCLLLGMPGSVKSGCMLVFALYATNHFPKDRVYWRSSLNSPLQFFKLPEGKYEIFCEKESGVHFIDRRTDRDVTDELGVRWFSSFEELYEMSRPGVVSACFFKDRHLRGVDMDEGTIGWFRWIRFLLSKYHWKFCFCDEYHELVKSGASGAMWREIMQHANDVSNMRKSNLSFFGCAHQVSELDYRVVDNIMTMAQMYGSKLSRQTPVNKRALGNIRRPTLKDGASGWVSCGGSFGRFNISEVLSMKQSIMAVIRPEDENVLRCPVCDRVFLLEDVFNEMFCSSACFYAQYARRKGDVSSPRSLGGI